MASSSMPNTLGWFGFHEAYYWLINLPGAPFGLATPAQKTEIHRALTSFNNNHDHLLPYEIDKAIDIVLGAYCDARAGKPAADSADSVGWVTKVLPDSLYEHIGFKKFLRTGHAAEVQLESIDDWIKKIQDVYLAHGHPRQPIDAWAGSMVCRTGLTPRKMRRIADDAALLGKFVDIHNEVEAHLERNEGLPAVETLPSIDALLYAVFLPTQPSHDRLVACRQFFHHLATLYRTVNDHEAVAHLEEALTDLNKTWAVQHFESLPLEQQGLVVEIGRRLLYFTCEARQQKGTLPSVHVSRGGPLAERLRAEQEEVATLAREKPNAFAALQREGWRPEWSTSQYALGHTRIAPRKAWRYYGTTAPEWEARW